MYHLGREYLCTVSSVKVKVKVSSDATVKELHYQAFISGKCMVTVFAEFRHTASVETHNTLTVDCDRTSW